MRASGVGPGRFITLLVAVSACLLSAAIATPAHAQFVCGGSGTGAEPQNGGGSSGGGGSVACGLGVTAPSNFSVALGTVTPGSSVNASGNFSVALGNALPFSSLTASGFESIAIGTGDV